MEPVNAVDKRRKYEAAFQTRTVRRVAEHSQPPTRVARAWGMSAALLGAGGAVASGRGSGNLQLENQQERAILK